MTLISIKGKSKELFAGFHLPWIRSYLFSKVALQCLYEFFPHIFHRIILSQTCPSLCCQAHLSWPPLHSTVISLVGTHLFLLLSRCLWCCFLFLCMSISSFLFMRCVLYDSWLSLFQIGQLEQHFQYIIFERVKASLYRIF